MCEPKLFSQFDTILIAIFGPDVDFQVGLSTKLLWNTLCRLVIILLKKRKVDLAIVIIWISQTLTNIFIAFQRINLHIVHSWRTIIYVLVQNSTGSSWIQDFLPTVMLWSFTALLPLLVSYSGKLYPNYLMQWFCCPALLTCVLL